MNPANVKHDREDLMADPLRALFAPESPAVPWWYPLWLRTLPFRWSLSRKIHPPVCRAVLITDEDLMDAVIFGKPLSRKQRVMQVWSITWRVAVGLAMFIACIWLAFAIPENL